jgi:8-oxo-dGTP diphosphatase
VVEVALAALYRRVEGRVELLVARRHAQAIRGGLWEFPGGKIEAGERASAAALREIAEEVGLGRDAFLDHAAGGAPIVDGTMASEAVDPLQPLLVVEHSDPEVVREKSLRLHAFVAEVKPTAQPKALGASEVRWIAVSQLPDFEWPKANAPINARLLEVLEKVLDADLDADRAHAR